MLSQVLSFYSVLSVVASSADSQTNTPSYPIFFLSLRFFLFRVPLLCFVEGVFGQHCSSTKALWVWSVHPLSTCSF